MRVGLAAIALSVLLVTAGCSSLLPGDDNSSPGLTWSSADVSSTPGPAPEPTHTPVASAEFRTAVSNHTTALFDAEQFVVRETIYQHTGEEDPALSQPVNQSFAADLAADRFWFGIPGESSGGVYDSGEVYQNETVVCRQQVDSNGTVRYRCGAPGDNFTPRDWALGWTRNAENVSVYFPFERNGTATFEGEEMARYTATEPGVFGCIAADWNPEELKNVTAFRATALVDDRGIIRKFQCVLKGHLQSGDRYAERVEWTITEVGTATVRPPENVTNTTPSGS